DLPVGARNGLYVVYEQSLAESSSDRPNFFFRVDEHGDRRKGLSESFDLDDTVRQPRNDLFDIRQVPAEDRRNTLALHVVGQLRMGIGPAAQEYKLFCQLIELFAVPICNRDRLDVYVRKCPLHLLDRLAPPFRDALVEISTGKKRSHLR